MIPIIMLIRTILVSCFSTVSLICEIPHSLIIQRSAYVLFQTSRRADSSCRETKRHLTLMGCAKTYFEGLLRDLNGYKCFNFSFLIHSLGDELVCLQSRPFTNRKHLAHHERKIWQRRPRTVEELESCVRQELDKSSSPTTPLNGLLTHVPDVYRLLSKEEGMLQSATHGPVSTFEKCCH
uniref:Uncharacterized protein n=1 Tax=Mola mola TaxID=94237 RepID=A0A3Q3W1C6_MOLML